MTDKYFLRHNDGPIHEVSLVDFVRAERGAGFRPKGEDRGQPATAGFSASSGVRGYVVNPDRHKPSDYDFNPELRDVVWPLNKAASLMSGVIGELAVSHPEQAARLREARDLIRGAGRTAP